MPRWCSGQSGRPHHPVAPGALGLVERPVGFTNATGFSPLEYVQRLRIEDAKRRLERTEAAIDEIGWKVGYEDTTFFRRLFKRTTGLTPGAYRKRFQVPGFANSTPSSPRA